MNSNLSTKSRLLKAACAVFAEKGFRDATVAEICEQAGANIAAVNYHFGDNEKLYDAVWHLAFELANEAYPVDAHLPEKPDLIDYLYSHASAILHRIFSESETGLFAKLLYHEMASPTLALDQIAQEVLQPQSEFLAAALRTRFGSSVTEAQLRRCMHSIIGQCAFYNFSRPLRERVLGCNTLTEAEIEETARHIASFSLGGLKAIQERSI